MADDVGRSVDRALDMAQQAELLDLTRDAIVLRDLRTSAVTYWNHGAEGMYGWSRQEAQGQITHTLLQTRFPVSLEDVDACLVRDGHWEGELVHTCRDGSTIVVSSRQAVQRDADGQPAAILEINTDITAQKSAEEERVRLTAEQRARNLAEQALHRVSRLQRVTAALSEALTPSQVAQVIVEQGIAALNAQAGRIVLFHADRHTVEVLASAGYVPSRRTFGIDEALPSSEVLRTRRPLFVTSSREVSARFPRLAEFALSSTDGALAAAPLIFKGVVVGAMTLAFEGDRDFEAGDRELLMALATQCAQALERARLYDLSLSIQEDLRRSRDQLAAILGGVAEGVTVQDAEGHLVYANEVAVRMMGLEPAVSVQEAAPSVLQGFTLFDESGDPFPLDDLPGRRILSGRASQEAVVRFRDLVSGDWRWSIVDAAAVRDAAGTLQLVVNIFRDITERKRHTDASEFLAAASTILSSTLDISMRLQGVADLAVSRVADVCQIDLIADRRQARRIALAETEPGEPSLAGPRSELVVKLVARGQTFGSITLATTHPGRFGDLDAKVAEDLATRVALAIDSARLYQEAQEHAEHQSMLNTALRETVEERDRALAELQQSLRTRDEFLASASHDLKSPLAAIKATAQLLQRRLDRAETPDVDRLRDGLQRMDAIADRAAGLVEELLDLARMQMGRPLDLDPQPANLVDLVREVIAEYQETTERHAIQLEHAQPELVGMWDTRRLERVLSNLLDNALKYSPAGGAVTVRAYRDAESAVVEVSDQGIGIPLVDQGRIFERFQRASNVEPSMSGTGIGLASARHILESHGGGISVHSQEHTGTTFVVRLPLLLESVRAP